MATGTTTVLEPSERTTPRADRLRILHVLAPAPFGGLEAVVRSLAEGHTAAGHRVDIAALLDQGQGADHPFLHSLQERGVGVHVVPLPGRAYGKEREAVRRLCREIRPDVVHTHGYRPDVVDAPVARALGIPVVSTVHGFTGGGVKNRVYEWLQRRAHRDLDAVVAVSRALERTLAGGSEPGRVRCIPNAWRGETTLRSRAEAREALGIPEAATVIGWVGRLSREKAPDVLVAAVAELSARGVPVVACLVGDGPERDRLVRQIERTGTSSRVLLSGSVPDAGGLMSAFDVFALSSRTEGTPIVLFEAMAAGVPIVATRVGGVPDVLTQGEALLVNPDDPIAMAAVIAASLREPADADRRVEAARARLERDYAVQPWLDRYEALYREVVAAAAGRRGGR